MAKEIRSSRWNSGTPTFISHSEITASVNSITSSAFTGIFMVAMLKGRYSCFGLREMKPLAGARDANLKHFPHVRKHARFSISV